MSSIRIVFLFGLLMGILLAIGSFWGTSGMVIAFAFAILLNFGSYWYSDKLVLKIYRAKIVTEKEYSTLHKIVAKLSKKAGIKKPKVAVMESETPNAFATGRNPENATVCATTGILNLLSEEELEAVFSHEISHVTNRDILVGTMAATIAGAIMLIGRLAFWTSLGNRDRGNAIGFIAMIIVAPLAAMMIQMAISRSREFKADASGAKLTGKPMLLASALQKISSGVSHHPFRKGNPATAHMFIINPFKGVSLAGLFSTHPPVEKRVELLRQMQA